MNRPQITADGYVPYVNAVSIAFDRQCYFAQSIKNYAGVSGNDAAHRCSPGPGYRCREDHHLRAPEPTKISTSYVERFNLTTRMQMRRFTRLTNGFSKNFENHQAAISLHIAWYNFCRVHETLRVTPAMALGGTDHIWTIGELVQAALSAAEPAPLPPSGAEARKGMRAARAKDDPFGNNMQRGRLTVIRGGRK